MAAQSRSVERKDRDAGRGPLIEEHVDRILGPGGSTRMSPDLVGDHTRLVAHEIRAQLGVLDGYLSLLEDGTLGKLPERVAGVLPEMRGKTQAIGHLIDDMLEDARLKDGGLHLEMRELDLREAVSRAVEDARVILPRTHELLSRVPDAPVIVEADRGRIDIILRNLLDNAVKYSPRGGRIDCTLEIEGDHALICVWDEGIGIDADDAPAVFRRFGRGRRRGARGGVGLGLYISRRLAQLHGGAIEASSRPGGGTVFRVTLPLNPERAPSS